MWSNFVCPFGPFLLAQSHMRMGRPIRVRDEIRIWYGTETLAPAPTPGFSHSLIFITFNEKLLIKFHLPNVVSTGSLA